MGYVGHELAHERVGREALEVVCLRGPDWVVIDCHGSSGKMVVAKRSERVRAEVNCIV